MSKFFREGEVVSVEGDNCEIQLSIEGFCSGKHQCAAAVFGKGISPERNKVRAKNSIHAQVGEKVIVEILSPGFYRSLFFVFLFPLIALFGGILSGIQIAVWMGIPQRSDLYAGIGGVIFFSCSFLMSRVVNQRVSPQYIIHIRVAESLNCKNCSLKSSL